MDNVLLHRGFSWVYDEAQGYAFYELGWWFAAFVFFGFVAIIIGFLNIVSYWKLYKKAGLPGWTFLVPVFNMVLMLKIANKPDWWLLLWFILLFIPVLNIVMSLIVLVYFLRSFARDSLGATLLTIFFSMFYVPYLAFLADVEYEGNKEELRQRIFK